MFKRPQQKCDLSLCLIIPSSKLTLMNHFHLKQSPKYGPPSNLQHPLHHCSSRLNGMGEFEQLLVSHGMISRNADLGTIFKDLVKWVVVYMEDNLSFNGLVYRLHD